MQALFEDFPKFFRKRRKKLANRAKKEYNKEV